MSLPTKNPAAVVSEGASKFVYKNHIKTNNVTQEKSYAAINAIALSAGFPLLWYPNARRHGQSLRLGNIQGDAGDSLWVCLKTGAWKDHATGEAGGDLISLFASCHGLSQGEARQIIADALGHDKLVKNISADERDNKRFALSIWNEAINCSGTVVEYYLTGRYLSYIPPSLRYHPSIKHNPTGENYPAMVAAITTWPEVSPHAIHRTYLSGGSKAEIKPNRMMLGSINGGAVQLGKADSMLCVAEGIETGLSIQQATGIATWAVLSASNYAGLIIPPFVKEIAIAADNDEVGINAAYAAAHKWSSQGIGVQIIMPPQHGCDFNDLIMMGGAL